MEFPTFNLKKFEKSKGAQHQKFSVQLDSICRETGFLILEGHGVPKEIIEAQWSKISDFFELPGVKKQKAAAPYSGYPYGWIGLNKEALAASKGRENPS